MTFRTVADFEALTGEEALTPAEIELIAACRAGEVCWLEDGKRPDTDTPTRHIRASLLRLLIVGGSDSCELADSGVQVWGGWIDESLNLDFAKGRGYTSLINCYFTDEPQMNSASLGSLNLTGSKLPGLFAQNVEVAQSVYLRNKFHATGTVALGNAKIGGQLDCSDGRFDGNGNEALNGQGVKVTDAVFLRNNFRATGVVNLTGAEIGGQLDCSDGRFDGNGNEALNGQGVKVAHDVILRNRFHATGTVNLNGAKIGGQLDCSDGRFDGAGDEALVATRISVKEGFFWQSVKVDIGAVSLEGAQVGDLVDDLASWPNEVSLLNLDGFTYDRIATFTDTEQRLKWLQNGAIWDGTFYPQPYVQLAKTLREQGHKRDALRISYVAEKIGRTHERKQLLINPDGANKTRAERIKANLKRVGFAAWDRLLRGIVGYGLYPFRSVLWLILLIVLATIPAHYAWDEGSMVPNSAPVLVSSGWLEVADAPNPAQTWSLTDPGRDWETFNRYAWAADLVIPIVDLAQTAAWAPSTERGPWGYGLWWSRWFLIIFGWIVTALGAAAITGIIRRE